MRQHTAFRVGRTTRCLDFRAALSVITTITDLIPGQRLFVFNGTSARRAPPAVPPGLPARAPEPLCVPELIFLGAGNPGGSRLPVLAAQSLPCGSLARGRAAVTAGRQRTETRTRPCQAHRESWRSRRRHTPRGYASLCWPASVPATRSRAVWGRQGDWRSGSAPRSHRGGRWFEPSIAHQLRTWRKARSDSLPGRPHPIRGWGLPMPGQVFSSLRASPRPAASPAPPIVCRWRPRGTHRTCRPGRRAVRRCPSSWACGGYATFLADSDYKITNSNCR